MSTYEQQLIDMKQASMIGDNYYTKLARGQIPGRSIMSGLGERESMGTTVSGEDIWRGNELTPSPTSHTSIPLPAEAGEQMSVVSENVNDTTVGTGVRRVKIHYIDGSGNEQTTTVDLDGTTPVDLSPSDVRFVNDMYAVLVGSGGVAAGHIKIYKTSTVGLVYNMIHAGGNKSLVPNRMVPLGYALILKGWHLAEAQGKRIAFRIRSTDMYGVLIPGVFCFKDTEYLKNATSGQLKCNLQIPALSVVKVSGWPDASLAEGSCGWWGELIQDGY